MIEVAQTKRHTSRGMPYFFFSFESKFFPFKGTSKSMNVTFISRVSVLVFAFGSSSIVGASSASTSGSELWIGAGL